MTAEQKICWCGQTHEPGWMHISNSILDLAIEQAKRYREKTGPAFDYQAYMVEMLNEIERLRGVHR